MEIKNQVALVTGAASGIGYAYTKSLLENNVKVAICDINIEKCYATAKILAQKYDSKNIIALHCDVTKDESFENAFKKCIDQFKRLDIVINNAGVFDESMENWILTMNINYGGVVRGTMLAIKYMSTYYGGNGGTVVQTSSIAGLMEKYHMAPMYRSTKRAIIDYSRAVGDPRSFKYLNIRVMTICPGITDTPLMNEDRSNLYLIKEHYTHYKENTIKLPRQTPDKLGKGLIEILKHGKTGDCWIVENNEEPRLANIPDIPY
ncbi:15-hydroxyprostaglandin dehydrogenase [NAD(+)]-like [Daktulosphaira vitifoliae]|uniref:15-hydroxyprostaglandin dehydrogenase [NAD(+)]-like n=1 Tax=Daktulosphaira vitifoliae TaxID=58002 RepID=UPI0021A981DC|nr:15-hydroxyprostaglandin dehydrogenase [NAD(+)]-like [Daktulosphaira vitifoliae]XP_050531782.1 15-hydroxyprostaglandin dehydrogenase [NAD(+)]-like [Daktulosphaira vitifoliae]